MPRNNKIKLVVWDNDSPKLSADYTSVLWRDFSVDSEFDSISIPQLVEESADSLRAQFLALVYEIGELIVDGSRVIDHLQIRPSLSYWWMTLLVEKCNFDKSQKFNDVIKLLALSDWVVGKNISSITLITSDQQLSECFCRWCRNIEVDHNVVTIDAPKADEHLKSRIIAALPLSIKSLLWLVRYVITRWPLNNEFINNWRTTKGRIVFFSYFFNLQINDSNSTEFKSGYWGNLPDRLSKDGIETNWIHFFVKHDQVPTATKAASVIRSFNNSQKSHQTHVLLDSFLGFGVVFRALKDWLKLRILGSSLERKLGTSNSSAMQFWPLFKQDWKESMSGSTAMGNLLRFNLIETAIKELPNQEKGVYLQENQGWEFGLIHAWNCEMRGDLVGVPHSTVRFWDLRYFFDPRCYKRTHLNDMPLPRFVACNGQVMRSRYGEGGYPVSDLVDVEALRYLYLDHIRLSKNTTSMKSLESVRVLVLGDYLFDNTLLQLKLLEKAISIFSIPVKIFVKPHPNCPISNEDFPKIEMYLVTNPIENLLSNCEVAFASVTTSAAVDAYCMGVPVITVLDPNILNFSPLRGCPGAMFASTSGELVEAIESVISTDMCIKSQFPYFLTDPLLPRWKKLLLE